MPERSPTASFAHPANAGILRYLSAGSKKRHEANLSPDSIPNPYYDLGTHPDVVARLWDEITAKLPGDCRWVVYGAPVLVHPESGVIFGFAAGTTYALRLPLIERREALRKGAERVHTYTDRSKLDLGDIGEEWVFGGWHGNEPEWLRAAYQFAGDTAR